LCQDALNNKAKGIPILINMLSKNPRHFPYAALK